jgi:hypothetical protein
VLGDIGKNFEETGQISEYGQLLDHGLHCGEC